MSNDPASGKAVLFDVDGTLLDTVPLIIESFRHTFQACLGHKVDDADILASIGTPLDAFFGRFWPEQAADMKKVYLEHNHARLDTNIGMFRKVPAMLDLLADAGIPMGVVTSKSQYSAMRSLKTFGIDRYFQVVISKESTARHKPDPEPVLEALRLMNLPDPDRVVFVGDSIHDLACAKRAGCRSAIVRWTLMPEAELIAAGPDLWLDDGRRSEERRVGERV